MLCRVVLHLAVQCSAVLHPACVRHDLLCVCHSVDPAQQTAHWFQMRLWTQARLMGCHAAACMAGADEAEVLNFSFELVRLTRRTHIEHIQTCCYLPTLPTCSPHSEYQLDFVILALLLHYHSQHMAVLSHVYCQHMPSGHLQR